MTTQLQTYFDKRAERLALQAKCNLLEQEEKDLMYEITKQMQSSNVDDYTDGQFHASLSTKMSASAQDWPALMAYIKETGAVDLLQKRITESAVKARWDSGFDVPGVIKLPKYVLSISKL